MRKKIELFKVLSEPNRIRILMMIMQKPLCVCEITSILKLTTPTVSNHLSYLRKEGFINDEKEGKWINYKINESTVNPIIPEILKLLPGWFDNEDQIKNDRLKVLNVDRHKIICGNKDDNKLN